jgi:ferredoxin--NADP+ reductase
LARGIADHAEEALALIKDANTYVFLSGLEKIATVFDQVMSERLGQPEAWKAMKQRLIDEGRWSELMYT